ncbi:uncharacterized protein LOC134823751 [Bolinopsis microptera]|uniref:uncharacterized protein LOC134823751 n=1 Tax=Bolinopsis microptera TaxID=2820187 RepID=UPI003079E94A
MTVEQQSSTTRTETEDLNNAALLQHKYNLTKSKSKEEEVGGPTLLEVLELQRSSAVVSRSGTKGGHSARGDGSNNISGGSDDGSQPPLRLAWLSRYDQRIIDLIFWKSKTKSFFTFSWIITILVVLRTHSAAYVLSAALMSLMIVMMLFVGGSTVLQAATLHTAKHPFASTLSGDITLPESMQSTISDVLLSLINGSLDFVGRIVLVQSFSLTLRAITLLWIIWAHIDDIYLLLIIMTCALFFIPKFYQEHTDTCESVIEVYEENSLTGVISAQFETLEAEQDAANKNPLNGNLVTNSKEVLTASITGILIVLLVKYFLANDQGEIPHLFTYIWSLYQSAVKSSQ